MPTIFMKAIDPIQKIRGYEWIMTSCALLCIGWILGGCSQATGPYFRPAVHWGPEQAMVYLYFPKQSGASDSYTLLANGMTVTRLDEGGYYPFRAAPGRKTFSRPGGPDERNLTVTIEPGRTYFVKVALIEERPLFSRFYGLFLVHEELAYAEINPLQLMATCPTTEGCAQSLK
jgi:hypothetical protein